MAADVHQRPLGEIAQVLFGGFWSFNKRGDKTQAEITVVSARRRFLTILQSNSAREKMWL
jgi:hypothetical protein